MTGFRLPPEPVAIMQIEGIVTAELKTSKTGRDFAMFSFNERVDVDPAALERDPKLADYGRTPLTLRRTLDPDLQAFVEPPQGTRIILGRYGAGYESLAGELNIAQAMRDCGFPPVDGDINIFPEITGTKLLGQCYQMVTRTGRMYYRWSWKPVIY